MAKQKSAWHSILPRGLPPSKFTLDELRSAKQAHAYLTERVPGPEGIAEYISAFRFLLFFGIACVAEDKYPPLTRCWKDLEKLFMSEPIFDDGVFVQSWALMDFPFGPKGQTALDYFEEFLGGTDAAQRAERFIVEARKSRLGLHQDIGRTKTVAKFRELMSRKELSIYPSMEQYTKGEILLGRTIAYNDQVFMFGDPKGFPSSAKAQIEDMVLDKITFVDAEGTVEEQYETFMKLAGPYWMSCVTKNDDVPILAPDQYRKYLDR